MLLRNLSIKKKLTNGMKLIVIRVISNRFIVAKRLEDGMPIDSEILLPRITMPFFLPNTNIEIFRRQFPIMLAYSHTINKSQGQTLTHVGIDNRQQVFSHGQLFVAFSRAKASRYVSIFVDDTIPPGKNNQMLLNIVIKSLIE